MGEKGAKSSSLNFTVLLPSNDPRGVKEEGNLLKHLFDSLGGDGGRLSLLRLLANFPISGGDLQGGHGSLR
jgi:hypothetical protein